MLLQSLRTQKDKISVTPASHNLTHFQKTFVEEDFSSRLQINTDGFV